MPVERAAGSPWNGWPDVHGIDGRIIVVRAISDLAEIFSVSRPTVYRTLKRQPAS